MSVTAIRESIESNISKNLPVLMVFDRDGTIVPYADHPDEAVMDDSLKETIRALVKTGKVKVAILSARAIKDLHRDFGEADHVILAGNYGLELQLDGGSKLVEPRAEKSIVELKMLHEKLEKALPRFHGAILEDHTLSLCLHWHNVPHDEMPELTKYVDNLQPMVKTLKLRKYPTSFEFFPAIDWTKADGLELIIKKVLPENGYVLFGGDTESDEPAMQIANDKGGVSIRVGANIKSTVAKYKFERPAQVGELLSQILNICD